MRSSPDASTAESRRPLRRGGAVLGTVVLLVALAAPGAMAEDGSPGRPADDGPPRTHAGESGNGAAGQAPGRGHDEEGAETRSDKAPPAHASGGQGTQGPPPSHAATPARDSDGEGADAPADQGRAGNDRADRGQGAPAREAGEPGAPAQQGNRGSVQLSADGETFPPDNEPHLPCAFYVMFYQFPEGTTEAEVLFEVQPPSGGPGVALTGYDTTVDLNGEAGPGRTFNGSQWYDLTDVVSGLEPHAQQGHHIRLTITTTPEDVSADHKHKVFWIDCDAGDVGEQPATANLLVDKVVTGDGAPAAGTVFTIEVTCEGVTETVAITVDGDPWDWNADGTGDDLAEGDVCAVSETDDQGATTVTVTVDGAAVAPGSDVPLDAGVSEVVVANDFPAEGAVGGVDVGHTDEPAVDVVGVGHPVVPDGDVHGLVDVAVLGKHVASPAPQPMAAQDVDDDTLPRTGISTAGLVLLALMLLGGGALALRQGRPGADGQPTR